MNHPLQPLTPMQRLGWLRHFSKIRCIKSFHDFKKGALFELKVSTVTVQHSATRCRHNGELQAVTFTGADLLVKIGPDAAGAVHRFLANPATRHHPLIHDLAALLEHFRIPEIPELALLHAEHYKRNLAALHALES